MEQHLPAEKGRGVVFKLSPGASGWTETVLDTFPGSSDGGMPQAGLVFDQPKRTIVSGAVVTQWETFTAQLNTAEIHRAPSAPRAVALWLFEPSPGPGGAWTETVRRYFPKT